MDVSHFVWYYVAYNLFTMGQPPHHIIQIQCGRPPPFVPAPISYSRKMIICLEYWQNASTLHGLNRVKIKTRTPAQNDKRKGTNNSTNNNRDNQKPYMMVPYYKGHSESLNRACSKHGVQVYFKGGITIKNLLVAPKDKDPILMACGVIYRYKCDGGSVMKNILVNHHEHLRRGSKNINIWPNKWPL